MDFKHKFINCDCYELSHVTRLTYYEEEEEFGLDFSLYKYPSQSYQQYRVPKNRFLAFFVRVFYKLNFYFTNLWWAIKGVPNWYEANTILNEKGALEMKVFIEECLSEKKE